MHGWIKLTHSMGYEVWVQISRIDLVRKAGDETQIVQGGNNITVQENVDRVMKLIGLAQ